jgi:hypothetical protein
MSDDILASTHSRIDGAMKKLALGEPYGLSVTLSINNVQAPNGQILQDMLCLVVVATMRNPMLGQPRLCFPVTIPMQPGFWIPDAMCDDIAKMALDGVRGIHAQMLSTLNEMDANAEVRPA